LRKAPKPASKRRTLRLRPDPGNNRNDPSKRRTLRLRPDPGNNRNDPSKQRTLLHPDPSKRRGLNPAGGEEEGPSQADAREANLSPEVRTNQFGSEDDNEHPRGSLSYRRLEAEVVRLSCKIRREFLKAKKRRRRRQRRQRRIERRRHVRGARTARWR